MSILVSPTCRIREEPTEEEKRRWKEKIIKGKILKCD
jgi:hypothetical protein